MHEEDRGNSMAEMNDEERGALQREIQAAIAAGREVEPDMDVHLAASAAERYTKDRAVRARAQGQKQRTEAAVDPHQPNPNLALIVRSLGTLVLIGSIAALFVVFGKVVFDFWWLIFFLFPLFGWIRGGGSRRRYAYRYNGSASASSSPPVSVEDEHQSKIRRMEDEVESLKQEVRKMKGERDYI
jgi:hypothetical protein